MINTITDNQNIITLINLYSSENPIMEIGDECYFLFFNAIDYHIPIIGKGIILYDRFNDTINKHYFISIKEIVDSKYTIDNFVTNKQIQIYPFNKTTLQLSNKPKVHKFNIQFEQTFFDENLIKIECFFVRKNLESIKKLQKEFLDVINKDTYKILTEITEFKNNL